MRLNSDLILEFEERDVRLTTDTICPIGYIQLTHANKLLRDEMSKWVLVEGHTETKSYVPIGTWEIVSPPNDRGWLPITHRARVMPPQPIKAESAEDLWAEFIQRAETAKQTLTMDKFIDYFKERARRILK